MFPMADTITVKQLREGLLRYQRFGFGGEMPRIHIESRPGEREQLTNGGSGPINGITHLGALMAGCGLTSLVSTAPADYLSERMPSWSEVDQLVTVRAGFTGCRCSGCAAVAVDDSDRGAQWRLAYYLLHLAQHNDHDAAIAYLKELGVTDAQLGYGDEQPALSPLDTTSSATLFTRTPLSAIAALRAIGMTPKPLNNSMGGGWDRDRREYGVWPLLATGMGDTFVTMAQQPEGRSTNRYFNEVIDKLGIGTDSAEHQAERRHIEQFYRTGEVNGVLPSVFDWLYEARTLIVAGQGMADVPTQDISVPTSAPVLGMNIGDILELSENIGVFDGMAWDAGQLVIVRDYAQQEKPSEQHTIAVAACDSTGETLGAGRRWVMPSQLCQRGSAVTPPTPATPEISADVKRQIIEEWIKDQAERTRYSGFGSGDVGIIDSGMSYNGRAVHLAVLDEDAPSTEEYREGCTTVGWDSDGYIVANGTTISEPGQDQLKKLALRMLGWGVYGIPEHEREYTVEWTATVTGSTTLPATSYEDAHERASDYIDFEEVVERARYGRYELSIDDVTEA
jgi:hypothetical protein